MSGLRLPAAAPVPRSRPCLLEVGSPTPRRLAPREALGGRRRDRGSRRGLSEAAYNRAPEGFSPGGRRSVGAGCASRAPERSGVVIRGPSPGVDGATPSIGTYFLSNNYCLSPFHGYEMRDLSEAACRDRGEAGGASQADAFLGWSGTGSGGMGLDMLLK
jgi:hypothetical protein